MRVTAGSAAPDRRRSSSRPRRRPPSGRPSSVAEHAVCFSSTASARAPPVRPRRRGRRGSCSTSRVIRSPSCRDAISAPIASGAMWPTPASPAGEAAVVISRTSLPRPAPLIAPVMSERLACHALGALVADDDHVARLDGPLVRASSALRLAVEDAGRAGEGRVVEAGALDDRALGGQRALEDRAPPPSRGSAGGAGAGSRRRLQCRGRRGSPPSPCRWHVPVQVAGVEQRARMPPTQ